MPDTLFAFLKGSASNANDTDPEQSSVFYNPPMEAHQNVITSQRMTIQLDDGDTKAITLVTATWVAIMARVIGHAKLTTVGVNWDGSTAITGITAGYGVERHPGMISAVTYSITSATFTGLADGTEIEYVVMTLAADNAL